MTLQEAIQVLKTGDPFEDAGKFEEALKTVISAYEITDEEIEEYAFRMYHEVEDSRWFEPLHVAAKAFRDGKIKQP